VGRLESESVTCWMAPRDVVPGADWGKSIIDAIESSRIMVLLFSQSANVSPQIKREVERAVNKGVYIIPFRVEDIPPARALEYFISTSQWMDASPPLERHLDNLAKTVKAVLKTPPLPGANVPAQLEKSSILRPPIPPPFWRKSIPIVFAIAVLIIVGGMGWYLGHSRESRYAVPAVTPTATSTPVMTPTATSTPVATPSAAVTATPIAVPTVTTSPPQAPNIINDEEVREFVVDHFRAEERKEVDYVLSQYDDKAVIGVRSQRVNKKDMRNRLLKEEWPCSFTVGDIRVAHSAIPDTVTAHIEYRFLCKDPASARSDSGRPAANG
jgi:TIR domain